MSQAPSAPLVIFGEVLFDHFPDGASVLGGAPFNVAWHLQGFGADPLFVSRVGDDALGERVLDTMARWGMARDGVQRDGRHATGTVRVTLISGQPQFDIVADVAYDHIDADIVSRLGARTPPAMIYHGSLALRQPVSRAALLRLRREQPAPVFVDINLRPPWWETVRVADALREARWVKLNDVELRDLQPHQPGEEPAAAAGLRARYGLDAAIVTRGAAGAFVDTREGVVQCAPVQVKDLVDTVGAGDAFSAVVLLGLTRGWDWTRTLGRAAEFAAAICRQRGATREDRDLYAGFMAKWGA